MSIVGKILGLNLAFFVKIVRNWCLQICSFLPFLYSLKTMCTHSKWTNEQTLAMHAYKNDTQVYYWQPCHFPEIAICFVYVNLPTVLLMFFNRLASCPVPNINNHHKIMKANIRSSNMIHKKGNYH